MGETKGMNLVSYHSMPFAIIITKPAAYSLLPSANLFHTGENQDGLII